ncbi:unnamed protein product [Camellia sinensis]
METNPSRSSTHSPVSEPVASTSTMNPSNPSNPITINNNNNQIPQEDQRNKEEITVFGFSVCINDGKCYMKNPNMYRLTMSPIIKKRKVSEREEGSHSQAFLPSKKTTDNYLMIKQELERKRIEDRIRSFRFYTPEECREEMDLGVSTKLKLFEDPWKIKKTLTSSDVNEHLCRLLLPAEAVHKHITVEWGGERVEQVEDMVGERVVVWDYDTGSEHELVFKRWRTSRSFVLVDNWVTWFVRRRELRDGDEIGLFWDASNSRFGFRVLARRVAGF